MPRRSYRRALTILAGVLAALAAGCTTSTSPRALSILVTNDDGVGAPGIDAMVQALETLPDVDVRVIAPANDQSGTGVSTSAAPPIATIARTQSGHRAVAVHGFPADAVLFADRTGVLDRVDVVVSGANRGENLGPVVPISGTIGAARTAARLGVPSVAVSQGDGDPPDFESGAAFAARWIEEHRAQLIAGTAPMIVTSINVPTCQTGQPRGVVRVPVSPGDETVSDPIDCEQTMRHVSDDVAGFTMGFITESTFDSDLRPPR